MVPKMTSTATKSRNENTKTVATNSVNDARYWSSDRSRAPASRSQIASATLHHHAPLGAAQHDPSEREQGNRPEQLERQRADDGALEEDLGRQLQRRRERKPPERAAEPVRHERQRDERAGAERPQTACQVHH